MEVGVGALFYTPSIPEWAMELQAISLESLPGGLALSWEIA